MSQEKKNGKLAKFLKFFEPNKSSCCCVRIEEVSDEKGKPVEQEKNKKCCS